MVGMGFRRGGGRATAEDEQVDDAGDEAEEE